MVACLISLVLFVIGLVGPLTPSEGCPRVLDLLLFWGLPVLLSIVAAMGVRVRPLQLLYFTQSTAVAASAGFLLHRIGCLW